MFDFGRPEDTAQLFRNQSMNKTGPAIADCDWREMEDEDLSHLLVYLYGSIKAAVREEANEEVIELLLNEYDEVFSAVAKFSEPLRIAVKNGRHQPVTGINKENIEKYRRLAGVEGSES